MIPPPPRLRSDLTVREEQTAGGTVSIVKDPLTGDFFRFRETERFIAQQCDGKTPLDVIRQRTEERFGATLAAESLSAFVQRLDRAGLLETADPAKRGSAGKRARRIRGSLLLLRLKVADPDRLFDRLAPLLRGLFTARFLALSAAVVVLGVGTAVANWSDVVQDLSRLYRLAAILPFLAITFLAASTHEFAHGLTCKHFGGEVHELGFMLIYFQPALYCNVSDAWLFPEKSQRLWVGFAGPYFELFLWALAVLVWRLTDVDTVVNYVALIALTGSGLKTLLNLSPLLKLDGYYMLSDYLDVPNLRRKSFRYVGSWIKQLSGRADQPIDAVSPRERRIYLGYGLLAAVPSLLLLAVGSVKMAGFLLASGGPLAVALFTGLLTRKVRRRAGRLFGKGTDDTDDDDPGDDPAPREPARKDAGPKWTRRRMALILAGVALPAVLLGRLELKVGGPVTILPIRNADVRTERDGMIEEVYVTEGDTVRAGDVVARLTERAQRADLQKTDAQIREARARLSLLEAGPTRDEIEVARTALDQAEERLKYARARRDRNKQLADSGVLTQTELENSDELATTAASDVAAARHKLALLLGGTRPEQLAATRAEIDGLEAQRRYLEAALRRAVVRSPVTGIVATRARDLSEMAGQEVQPGALIAKVYDLRKLAVEVAIPEREIADVRVGQPVAFKARAYPNRTFHGTVTAIATAAEGPSTAAQSGSGRNPSTIRVTSEIDNGPLLLKPGMTGQAKVFCGPRRIVELVMRRLALTMHVNVWSWW